MCLPTTAVAITRSAEDFFGAAPGLRGGMTPWGAYLLRFAQTILCLHGVSMRPIQGSKFAVDRDAGSLGELETADLAFLPTGTIVARLGSRIALGQNRLIQLALGRGVSATECLRDSRGAYVQKLRVQFLGSAGCLR